VRAVLFPLSLQPYVDQPPDGFRAAGQVIFLATPISHLLHQLSPNARGRAIATMKLGFRRLRRGRRTVRLGTKTQS
jgi:hypothetical protein